VKLTAYTVFDFPGGGVMGRTGISGDEDVIVSPSGKVPAGPVAARLAAISAAQAFRD
jgi:hypothetical protein